MKKAQLITLILIGFVLSNCDKEEKKTEIKIKYELFDDVSPVKGFLSVNEDIGWSEWIINDTAFYHPNGEDYIEHIFREVGISNIKLNASIGGNKYFGDLEIDIPEIATKLIIYGYYFKQDYEFNIMEDTLSFEFNCYNSKISLFSKRFVSKIKFENNDTVLFDTPIIFDISGFENAEKGDELLGYFRIKAKNVYSSYYWGTNFFINEQYYIDRLDFPNYIYLDNLLGKNRERIYIISDWTR